MGLVTVALSLVFSNSFLFRAAMLAWQTPAYTPIINQPIEVGVLLSGMTFSDQKKRVFFGGTADRFIQAAQLFHTGKIKQIIISGGDGSLDQNRPQEAGFLKQQMLNTGISATSLIVEPLSRNTFESAVACRHIIDSLGFHQPVVLVTSAMHMRRAHACFVKQGIQTIDWPANFEVTENQFGFAALIPSIEVLSRWQSLLKEVVGLQVYKLTDKA